MNPSRPQSRHHERLNPMSRRRRSSCIIRRGAVLALMIVLLPVLLLVCAFAINSAYMGLNRTEMFSATDAAARAGGREFTITRNQAAARSKAQAIAALNEVAGKPLTLTDSDCVFGMGTRPTSTSRYSFTSGGPVANALQVNARRTSAAPDGPIPLLLPNVFGINHFELSRSSTSTQVEVDIALVIDRSGSMAYAANEPAVFPPVPASAPAGWAFCDAAPPLSRWRNVVSAVTVFLNELTNSPADELVSLSTYNGAAVTDLDLTNNYSQVLTSLNVYTNSFCAGGTNIGGGINEGGGALQFSPNARPGAIKVIVVLTDGIHNIGFDPTTAANTATAGGVLINTITFSDEADQTLMASVAYNGHGKHFHASSPSDLMAIFQEIAKQLPTLLTR